MTSTTLNAFHVDLHTDSFIIIDEHTVNEYRFQSDSVQYGPRALFSRYYEDEPTKCSKCYPQISVVPAQTPTVLLN